MRQIVLDTETTGIEVTQGHRIIEIGAVEMVDRKITPNFFHEYVNPQRDIDAGAQEVHGISSEFLADKPLFADIAEQLVQFLEGAELIIHNASFDVGFINAELLRLKNSRDSIEQLCSVTDTLKIAREKHPGQRNSLDALCKRYEVDNFDRSLHGALLDSRILAEVYLRMTGGQTSLGLHSAEAVFDENSELVSREKKLDFSGRKGKIIKASRVELDAHNKMLDRLREVSESGVVWDG